MIDVIIAGGGPAGSVCAARLRQHGKRVLLLEREHFPRFHLGESLLPQSLPILEAIGALEKTRARFIEKHAARFTDDRENGGGRLARFVFANAFSAKFNHAFQVPRDEFDHMLLDHAKELGAEVQEGVTVARMRKTPHGVAVDTKDSQGNVAAFDAAFFIDATGRDAMLAHEARDTEKIERLDKTSLFAHFRNTNRRTGIEEGDIDIVVFGGGWFWVIPFKDGRTSIGAVVSSEWLRNARDAGAKTTEQLFARAISESPTVSRAVEGATQLWPARATADFSYRVRTISGERWLAIGDAAGFIDPLFSTGAHIAMHAGFTSADALNAALDGKNVEPSVFEPWVGQIRAGVETFIFAVQAFYSARLLDYLFEANPRTVLRRSFTTLLAGDVFHSQNERWMKDTKLRLSALAQR